MLRKLWLCLLFVSLLHSALGVRGARADDELREWSDSTGNFRTQAAFVSSDGKQVTLERATGETLVLSLDRLSREDQNFVRQATRKKADKQQSPAPRAKAQPAVEASAPPNAPSWSQWRGPNRDGISPEQGLISEWPKEGPPVVWQTMGFGDGYSSLTIADGKVVTMGNIGGQTHLVAANLEDGVVQWTAVVGGGDAPNCTPTIDGQLVYGLSHSGDLLCAELATGKEVWRKSFPNDFGGKMMSSWGYSESPLVDEDRLIVTPGAADAALAALNKFTGETIWKAAIPAAPGPAGQDGAGYSSVVISQAAGTKQYVQLVGRGVIGVEAESGRFLWGYNRVANGTANVPTPIVSGDFIFCSSGYDDGGSALLRLSGSRGRVAMQEVWYKPSRELQNHHGGMILVGEYLYMGHGHNNGFPVCVHLKTGRDTWRPGRGPGTGSAAVTYADGHLYFRYENGKMALIEANPQSFQLKGTFDIAINNGRSWAHPVVYDGRLYLRDQDELICYSLRP